MWFWVTTGDRTAQKTSQQSLTLSHQVQGGNEAAGAELSSLAGAGTGAFSPGDTWNCRKSNLESQLCVQKSAFLYDLLTSSLVPRVAGVGGTVLSSLKVALVAQC